MFNFWKKDSARLWCLCNVSNLSRQDTRTLFRMFSVGGGSVLCTVAAKPRELGSLRLHVIRSLQIREREANNECAIPKHVYVHKISLRELRYDQDSSVDKENSYGLDGWGPTTSRVCFSDLCRHMHTNSGIQTTFCLKGTGFFFPWR
jgi:hypothetical protein